MSNLILCGDSFLDARNGRNPFSLVTSCFQNKSVCINLETSLAGPAKHKDKTMRLCVVEDRLSTIPDAVNIISFVNNHISDGGPPEKMVQALEMRSKIVVGPANPSAASATIHGVRVDFFSAYFSLPRFRLSYNGTKAGALVSLLHSSSANCKVVNLHWGYEHTTIPAPFQRELGRKLIDAGADIVIGHHPHVSQGWETYNGKAIFYSLGNFNFWQFDTESTENNQWGYMVDYDLTSGKTKPIVYRINDDYQPYLVSNEDEKRLFARLDALCESIANSKEESWFNTQYAGWYAREVIAWRKLCSAQFAPLLFMKRLAWICLPLQFKYYAYSLHQKWSCAKGRDNV